MFTVRSTVDFNRARTAVNKATTEALEKVGQQGTTYAKQNSPTVTGRLKGSMGYTISGRVEMSENDPITAKDSDMEVIIGTNVIYAPAVEYKPNSKGSNGFMQRSFNQVRQVAERIMGDHIKREVG